MRTVPVIIAAVLIAVLSTASSYMAPTNTAAVYVYQDSLSPISTYDGVEDAYLSAGSAQKGRNRGRQNDLAMQQGLAASGIKVTLMRHNPFTGAGAIDSTNVASWDSITVTLKFIAEPTAGSRVDTMCFRAELANWVEGPGTGQATDSCGCTGTARNAEVKCGGADTAWAAFRSAGADTPGVFSGMSGKKADSLANGFSLDIAKAWGGLLSTKDTAPYPSVTKLLTSSSPGTNASFTVNITNLATYFLKRNLAVNMLIYVRADTSGGLGGTPDSVGGYYRMSSSDQASYEQGGLSEHPKFTYYVHLKRMIGTTGPR